MDLARETGGEIVSCDSLQVYRGFDIGSAKPTAAERREVRHHLIDVVEPEETFSAAAYASTARAALADLRARGVLPIVVGGGGLYLKALLEGLFVGPSRDETLRERLHGIALREGTERLHTLLAHVDPETASRTHPRDEVRIVRALEVFRRTERTLSSHHQGGKEPLSGFDVSVIGVAVERGALRERVEARTRGMFSAGLLEETAGLLARPQGQALRPLKAIGYRQAVKVVRGEMGRAEAERGMVVDTMRYAKRQMTWFRHQSPGVRWCDGQDAALAAARESSRR
jgi:tRNA dimethylallyltransferase